MNLVADPGPRSKGQYFHKLSGTVPWCNPRERRPVRDSDDHGPLMDSGAFLRSACLHFRV